MFLKDLPWIPADAGRISPIWEVDGISGAALAVFFRTLHEWAGDSTKRTAAHTAMPIQAVDAVIVTHRGNILVLQFSGLLDMILRGIKIAPNDFNR